MNLSSETAQVFFAYHLNRELALKKISRLLPRRNNDANLSLPVLIAIAVCVSVEKEIEK